MYMGGVWGHITIDKAKQLVSIGWSNINSQDMNKPDSMQQDRNCDVSSADANLPSDFRNTN